MAPFEAGRCADQVWRVIEDLIPEHKQQLAARRVLAAFSPGAEFYKHSPIVEASGKRLHDLAAIGVVFHKSNAGG